MNISDEHLALAGKIATRWLRKLPYYVKAANVRQAARRGVWDALRHDPEATIAYLRLRINGEIIQELREHDWLTRAQRTRGDDIAFLQFDAPEDLEAILEQVGAAEAPTPEDALIEKRLVERALATPMNATDERIMREYFIEGRSMRAIGEGLGISEARVSQRTSTAIERMRCTVMA